MNAISRLARTLLLGLGITAAIVAIAMPGTASAIAFCAPEVCGGTIAPEILHPSSTYIGWGYTRGLGICPPGAMCIWSGEIRVPAWRWNGAWNATTVDTGTRVWIYPFSGEWRWIWTSSTGWLAMQQDRLLLKQGSCWDYARWINTCFY